MEILIVEEHLSLHSYLKRELEGADFTDAYSVRAGHKALHDGFLFICVGACVKGSQPTTLPLIKKMDKKFGGPTFIFGMSGIPAFCEKMKKAGCDYVGDRILMAEKIKEIIKQARERRE